MDEITAYLPGLSPVENKELCVRFDGGRLSSDGGVLVLREIEKRLGLAARLAGCLSDARDPASTTHSYADMIGARMFAIACGYEDCDDLDVLRFDPAFKLACGRLPESGRDLMSQPTLSRLENAPSWRELARMGLTMIDLFCDSFERVPQRIVLDIDDTPDAVHGGQQLALFNAHYDEYCFQPIHIFDAATAKPVLSLLRPGKRPSGDEAARVLRHVIGRIRRHWPRVEIAVRGDGHYGTPEVMDLLEDQGHGYILGLPGNARLSEIGQPWCEDAALRRVQSGKDKVRRFFQTGYQAKSWSRERKVVARVEATARGTDVRFVVTNLPGRAKLLYERVYCARGRMERHDQGAQALHQIRPHLVSPMGSQPVPAVPAHRRLLAAASVAPDRAPPLAVAHRDAFETLNVWTRKALDDPLRPLCDLAKALDGGGHTRRRKTMNSRGSVGSELDPGEEIVSRPGRRPCSRRSPPRWQRPGHACRRCHRRGDRRHQDMVAHADRRSG